MRRVLIICLTLLVALPLSAQTDKREVRRGNRKFGKQNYKEAELDYRRALVKDSITSPSYASAVLRVDGEFVGHGNVFATNGKK